MGPKSGLTKESSPDSVFNRYLGEELRTNRQEGLQRAIEECPHQDMYLRSGHAGDVEEIDRLGHLVSYRFADRIFYKSKEPYSDNNTHIQIFEPYDVHSSEDAPVELETRAVAIDLYHGDDPAGHLIVFRLGYSGEPIGKNNLSLGDTARFGAIVNEDGHIQPIVIDKNVEKTVVHSQLTREDPTSENGERVDAELKTNFTADIDISAIDESDDLHEAVLAEIDRFIEACAPEGAAQ